jgi:hypothetical protein
VLVTVGFAEDVDAMAVLGKAIDECDDTRGTGEDAAPLLEAKYSFPQEGDQSLV